MSTAGSSGLKLGVNGFGRIGKLTVWHHVARKFFDEIFVNIGLIMDYGGDLPPDLVDLVQFEPGNYEVVTLNEHENMRSVLDKLVDAAEQAGG